MNEAATDVIVARSRDADRLTTMVAWSIAAHVVVTALIMIVPSQQTAEPPRTVMTISLGGAPGPRTGGMTQMGSRAVQAPPPDEPVRRAETAPAPTPPKMSLPDPRARTRPETAKPATAPRDAASRTAATGEKPNPGTTTSSPQVRGQGFGLSSAGGTGGQVTVDGGNFCCPAYLADMIERIERNWNKRQTFVGTTTMRFTIQRDGSLRNNVTVEKSSGFTVLDDAARRALAVVKLPALPNEYPNQELTVHLEFVYSP